MLTSLNLRERLITGLIKSAGYSAIFFVLLIFYFLIQSGLPALAEIPADSLWDTRWYPIEDYFGLLPLIGGSLVVTIGAGLVAVPFGLGTAIYIAEIAPRWVREILKPLVELLAGLPSVMLGFLGIIVLSPFLRSWLDLPTGLSALTASLLLGFISLPTIVSIAEDALDAVPKSYRDAALAMGATEWQTLWRVTIPAARTGIFTAVMLGVGRAIGETMTVMMVAGNAPIMPNSLRAFLSPVRTMTATIAAEMGGSCQRQYPLPCFIFCRDCLILDVLNGEYRCLNGDFPPAQTFGAHLIMKASSTSAARYARQRLVYSVFTAMAALTVIPIVGIILYILSQGLPAISWEFLSAMPRDGMRAGGVWPAIVGTIYLTLGTAVFAVPIGVGAAIYLSEYAPDNRLTRLIRLAIINLAGIPSVVYGLFGLGLFVLFLNFGTSILAGSLTLAIMTLPVIIATSEEALRAVPQSFRVVSISLGGTRWQTIQRIVLPQALPGVLTGVILGLERAAGETAPILFTVAAFFLPSLPNSPFDATMALPYHLFVISTQVPGMPVQIQYGTALVLVIFVLLMNLIATIIRSRARARRQW